MKHEYDGGEIIAVAGGSRRHNALASRITAALENGREPGGVAFQSDQRIRILATGKATYPDASLVCGPIEGDPADPTGAAITSPTLIVEVQSPSTEQDDRGDKWQHYQLLPSLQEYVLVSPSEPARLGACSGRSLLRRILCAARQGRVPAPSGAKPTRGRSRLDQPQRRATRRQRVGHDLVGVA